MPNRSAFYRQNLAPPHPWNLPLNSFTPGKTHNLLVLLPQFIFHFPTDGSKTGFEDYFIAFLNPERKVKTKHCYIKLFRCSSIQWIRSQTRLCKSTRVKDAKWLGSFHQLDLQTRTLPELLKRMQKHLHWRPDEKRIRDLNQLDLETRHSDWTFHFSSFESLISLPSLIKRW